SNQTILTAAVTVSNSIPAGDSPEARFLYYPVYPVAGGDIIFDGSGSADSDTATDNLIYKWQINTNQLASSLSIVTQTIDEPGKYTILLEVKDSNGNISISTGSVYVDYSDGDYFASKVYSISPAPGQFVNDPALAMTNYGKITGPPEGKGTYSANTGDVISLGSGGGSVVVGFESPVINDPENIHGYDFILFGNAIWFSGNPSAPWLEPAVVYVSVDDNSNDQPDDNWYILKPAGFNSSNYTNITYSRTNVLLPPEKKTNYPSSDIYSGVSDELEFYFYSVKEIPDPSSLTNFGDCTPVLIKGDMSGASGSGDENLVTEQGDNIFMDPSDFYTIPDRRGDRLIDPGSC
ncbi:MAG: hypothetical protein KAS39_04890, partial [Actinomycetia bacterium]|nr:hypothetical protein [Actinomycetes bacterium]